MLEQRQLLRFLTSASPDLDTPSGQSFFDMVAQFSDDELVSFLQPSMAAIGRAERKHGDQAAARRYGKAELYVIQGGRR